MLSRLGAATLLLALLTACGDDAGQVADEPTSPSTGADRPTGSASPSPPATETAQPPSSTEPEPTKPGARIVVTDSEFGPMLFDGTGQAIYLFDVETTSKPECYDACAEAWPPVLTQGEPAAGPGVDGTLLATTERADGTLQVTYDDHPLYFYAHEDKGEVKCHDVFLNGGNWYAVSPDGDPAPST